MPGLLRGPLARIAVLAAIVAMLAECALEPLDRGYVRYAWIATDMVDRGDFVVPRLDGATYASKPPLFLWIVALPIVALGRAPSWAGHLPNLLGAALTLAALFALARRATGRRDVAAAAALLVATFYECVSQWRGERLDPLFAGCFAVAIERFHAALNRDRAAAAWLLGGVALGGAVMVKGPVALLALLAIAPYAVWIRRLDLRFARGVGLALAATIAIALPWFLLVLARLGWTDTLATIRATDFGTRHEPIWVYAVGLITLVAPWCALHPALGAWLRTRPWRTDDAVRIALCWFVPAFVALHFSDTRHTRYLLPFLPGLALLFAALIAADLPAAAAKLRRLGLGAIAALGALGAVALPFVGLFLLDRERWLAMAGIVPAAIAVLAARRFAAAPFDAAVVCALMFFAQLDLLRVRRDRADDHEAAARAALAAVGTNDGVGGLDLDPSERGCLSIWLRRPVADAAALEPSALPEFVVTTPDGAKLLGIRSGIVSREVARFALGEHGDAAEVRVLCAIGRER